MLKEYPKIHFVSTANAQITEYDKWSDHFRLLFNRVVDFNEKWRIGMEIKVSIVLAVFYQAKKKWENVVHHALIVALRFLAQLGFIRGQTWRNG